MGFFHVRNSSHGYRKEGVERTSSNCEIVRTSNVHQAISGHFWMKEKAVVCQYSTVYSIQLPLTPFSSTDKHRQTLSSTMEVILSRPLYHVQFITKNHSNNCLIIRTTLCYRQLSWPQNYQIPTISSSIVRISLLRSGQMFRSMSDFRKKDIWR